MRLVIVTGISGAGKSTALKMLEDMGYFCVDNLPVQLLCQFAQMVTDAQNEMEKAAVGMDARGGRDFSKLESVLKELDQMEIPYEILFLDAQDEVLVKRYKETRRRHPLGGGGRVDTGIALEREKTLFLREKAGCVLNTSRLLTRELKNELTRIFLAGEPFKSLSVTILSFGFKHGLPHDADLVFDVRFLPNPYYVDELRALTGNDKEVQDYVRESGAAETFLSQLQQMLCFLMPHYVEEGKTQLVVAIGCTGGHHRSVTIANELYARLHESEQYAFRLEHRDIV